MNQESKTVTLEQRYAMIAEAAYYHAEKRGFQEADQIADWLAAEKEIDALLCSTLPSNKNERDIFLESLETQLKEWDKLISGLKKKTKKIDDERRIIIDSQLENHRKLRIKARNKLKALRQSSSHGWEEIKEETEKFWNELHRHIQKIAEHF